MLDYINIILPIITGLGGIILTWFFGGRQGNKNTVDNDSHQREKDYYDMVENSASKKTDENIKIILRCASKCSHSLNCPILNLWGDSNEEEKIK